MAIAFKCDICGALYEGYNTVKDPMKPNGFSTANIDYDMSYHNHKVKCCCPSCMSKITDFIENLEKEKDIKTCDSSSWIYSDVTNDPDFNEKIRMIEKALGFRLFFWQKSYIYTNQFRLYGETTAKSLKLLLDSDQEPLDFSTSPTTFKEDTARKATLDLKNKLDEAGIRTRDIITKRGVSKKIYKGENV